MQIETDRLLLRELRPEDRDALASYHSLPRFYEFYGKPTDTDQLLKLFLKWQVERPRYRYQFAITVRGNDRPLGCAGIRKTAPDSTCADIGFELDPDSWGHGFAREAVEALVSLGGNRLAVSDIVAETRPGNLRARRLLESVGFFLTEECDEDGWAHYGLYSPPKRGSRLQ